MLEPPSLSESDIKAALDAHYSVRDAALTFLPIGNDAATWVYRLQTRNGETYFLKLRGGESFSAPSMLVPFALQQQGVPHIVAPLATSDGSLWINLNGLVLTLYPYIDGRVSAEKGLSTGQWRAFGTLARRIHNSQLPPEVLKSLPRERFVPDRRELIEELQRLVASESFANAEQRAFAAFWNSHRDTISTVVARADELGNCLRQASAPHVLCHADMHAWNVLLDGDDNLWLVDWDEVILALKERDLMFVVGGIVGDGVGSQQTEWFLESYGDVEIDATALAYYRYAWAVQDIAAYGEALFFSPELGELSRRSAVRYFKSLFEEGSIVPRALRSPTRG